MGRLDDMLDKKYVCGVEGGIELGMAVITADNPGEVVMPFGNNDGGILGITIINQANEDAPTLVRRYGLVDVQTTGTVNAGDELISNGATGLVQTIATFGPAIGTLCSVIGIARIAAANGHCIMDIIFKTTVAPAP